MNSSNAHISNMNNRIFLREVINTDIPFFFQHQLDPVAQHMAAFTRKYPENRDLFDTHWNKIRNDANVTIRTIIFENNVAGHVASFGPLNEKEVTYWIDQKYWGKGIATEALSQFLQLMKIRPLYAHAAKDNTASIKTLEKCGFTISSYCKFFANARGKEIEAAILRLNNT